MKTSVKIESPDGSGYIRLTGGPFRYVMRSNFRLQEQKRFFDSIDDLISSVHQDENGCVAILICDTKQSANIVDNLSEVFSDTYEKP